MGGVVVMGGVTLLCLRAPVDDFMVLGAGTGWVPQALTPSAPLQSWPTPPGEMAKAALVSPLVPLCVIWGGEAFCIGTLGIFWDFLYLRSTSSGVCLGIGAAACCRQWGRADLLGIC